MTSYSLGMMTPCSIPSNSQLGLISKPLISAPHLGFLESASATTLQLEHCLLISPSTSKAYWLISK